MSCLCLLASSVSPITFSVAVTTRLATSPRTDWIARSRSASISFLDASVILAQLLGRLACGVDHALRRLARVLELRLRFLEVRIGFGASFFRRG